MVVVVVVVVAALRMRERERERERERDRKNTFLCALDISNSVSTIKHHGAIDQALRGQNAADAGAPVKCGNRHPSPTLYILPVTIYERFELWRRERCGRTRHR